MNDRFLIEVPLSARLVLVRHGESLFNSSGRFTGWCEVGLSDVGLEQSRTAAKALAGSAFDRVFTSDLHRVIHTAEIIFGALTRPPPARHVVRVPELRGRNDGDLVGLDKVETARRYGDELAPLWRRRFDLRLPGGESLRDVVRRVDDFFNRHIVQHLRGGEAVLIVTHGNTIRALLATLGLCDAQTVAVSLGHSSSPAGKARPSRG